MNFLYGMVVTLAIFLLIGTIRVIRKSKGSQGQNSIVNHEENVLAVILKPGGEKHVVTNRG